MVSNGGVGADATPAGEGDGSNGFTRYLFEPWWQSWDVLNNEILSDGLSAERPSLNSWPFPMISFGTT